MTKYVPEFLMLTENYRRAADAVASATALFIGAGAGMGVDSGLPDFRGPEGFWKAYPPFRGKQFHEMSTPHWFATDPQLAWGFLGHRWNLYRSATPHDGFQILLRWASRLPTFVFTSNVDGQFQKVGFPESQIYECHGSIRHLQCAGPCTKTIWPDADLQLEVNPETIRTNSPLPRCPQCLGMARPNILMFGDHNWVPHRSREQLRRQQDWLRDIDTSRLVKIEMGAGLAIPTVRLECESLPGILVRINPREAEVPEGDISLPVGALTGLGGIDAQLPAEFH